MHLCQKEKHRNKLAPIQNILSHSRVTKNKISLFHTFTHLASSAVSQPPAIWLQCTTKVYPRFIFWMWIIGFQANIGVFYWPSTPISSGAEFGYCKLRRNFPVIHNCDNKPHYCTRMYLVWEQVWYCTYLQNGCFIYTLIINEGIGIPGTRRDSDDAFGVSDDTVAGLDVRAKQLQRLSSCVGAAVRANFRHVQVQLVLSACSAELSAICPKRRD